MNKAFDLKRDARRNLLIAGHRGVMGGNIPGNTIDAFEAALYQGVDILELDITKSIDGVLYVFHPGMEPITLHSMEPISKMHSSKVEQLHYMNPDSLPTRHKVLRLDEFLEQYKNRCYLNIDKFWMWIPEITQALRRHNMTAQALAKVPAEEKYFEQIEQLAPDIPFLSIASERDDVSERLLRRKLSYAGMEALFTADDSPIASAEYIDFMHKNNLLVWANAIVYSYQVVLAAGHSDDASIVGQPEIGWGWLAARGFDIIQTDWPLAMRRYLEETGRRTRA